MFEPAELDRLVPGRERAGGPDAATLRPLSAAGAIARQDATNNGQLTTDLPPLAATEAIARGFLAAGGKHSRPFITLAVYDALTGGAGTLADGAEHVARLPDAVKRIALAIEVFHKASLVHDDIEDDDWFRYGRPALHRQFRPGGGDQRGRLPDRAGLPAGRPPQRDVLGAGGHGRHPGRNSPGPTPGFAKARGRSWSGGTPATGDSRRWTR